MVKKQIRLTEAKIAEMAVEVAKRMLKEGLWNGVNDNFQKDKEEDVDIDWISNESIISKLNDYRLDLEDIRNDVDYVNGNPEAFKQAWNYLMKCTNKQYENNKQLISMMKVIKDYIKQYAETISK